MCVVAGAESGQLPEVDGAAAIHGVPAVGSEQGAGVGHSAAGGTAPDQHADAGDDGADGGQRRRRRRSAGAGAAGRHASRRAAAAEVRLPRDQRDVAGGPRAAHGDQRTREGAGRGAVACWGHLAWRFEPMQSVQDFF